MLQSDTKTTDFVGLLNFIRYSLSMDSVSTRPMFVRVDCAGLRAKMPWSNLCSLRSQTDYSKCRQCKKRQQRIRQRLFLTNEVMIPKHIECNGWIFLGVSNVSLQNYSPFCPTFANQPSGRKLFLVLEIKFYMSVTCSGSRHTCTRANAFCWDDNQHDSST